MTSQRVRTDADARWQANRSGTLWLHAMLTLLTGGLWFPILFIVYFREQKRFGAGVDK